MFGSFCYLCVKLKNSEENWDIEDPYDPEDTGNSGGVSLPDPVEDDPSISVIVREDEEPEEQEPKTECKSLKQLVQNDSIGSNILPIVNQLRTKLGVNDNEWSISFENKWVDGNRKSLPDEIGIQEGISRTRSKFKYGNTWVGQIHTHPDGTYSVFSWLDLKAIMDIYNECHENFNEDVFLMAVAPNNVTYALKVNDIQNLIDKINGDFTNSIGNNDDEKGDYIMEEMAEKYNKSNNLEQTFLELYGNYGISFYKATNTDLTNWKQLELDENDDEIVNETPCN